MVKYQISNEQTHEYARLSKKTTCQMRTYCKLLCALPVWAALMSHSVCRASETTETNNGTITRLDIPRYMGRWYEIARYDHRFERGMTHVFTEYTLEDNGKIRVVNHGIKNGKQKEITGKAKQPNPSEYPGRLKVSFFLWFYSDYYILELDTDYQYAIVGSSSDKYLWILSRTPELPQSTLDELLKNIEQRGYDLSKLILVEQ